MNSVQEVTNDQQSLFQKIDGYLRMYSRQTIKLSTLGKKYSVQTVDILNAIKQNDKTQYLIDNNQSVSNYHKQVSQKKQISQEKPQKSKQKTIDQTFVQDPQKDLQKFMQVNQQLSQLTSDLEQNLKEQLTKEQLQNNVNQDSTMIKEQIENIDIDEQEVLMGYYKDILYSSNKNDWAGQFKQDVEMCLKVVSEGFYYKKIEYFLDDPDLMQIQFKNKIFQIIYVCLQLLIQQKTEPQYRDYVFHNNLEKMVKSISNQQQNQSIIDSVMQILRNTVN